MQEDTHISELKSLGPLITHNKLYNKQENKVTQRSYKLQYGYPCDAKENGIARETVGGDKRKRKEHGTGEEKRNEYIKEERSSYNSALGYSIMKNT